YPIEQLAESSNYLEVAYLLVYGELPTKDKSAAWNPGTRFHTYVHEKVKTLMHAFRYDADPLDILSYGSGALSRCYPEAQNSFVPDDRHLQMVRMIAKMPTLGAWAFRHAQGKPYVYPNNDLSYPANFLSMLFQMSERVYDADPRLVRALDTLFIL